MWGPAIDNKIDGGSQSGIIGAAVVTGNTITIYNYSPPVPAPTAPIDGPEDIPRCPYPGLAYFGPNDSARFFGRDKTIAQLTSAVSRQSFTVLAGASGSGKSSVVLAGLAPHLAGMGDWLFSYFRVGTQVNHDPFIALARAGAAFRDQRRRN
jgi:hypothetical protein